MGWLIFIHTISDDDFSGNDNEVDDDGDGKHLTKLVKSTWTPLLSDDALTLFPQNHYGTKASNGYQILVWNG